MILIQVTQVGVHDISFGTKDVVELLVGAGSLLSVYFLLYYKVQRGGEIMSDYILRSEAEHEKLHARIDDTRDNHNDLEKDLMKKHDEIKTHMNAMELRIIEKISEIKNKI